MAEAALVLSIRSAQTLSDTFCVSSVPAAGTSLFTPAFQSAAESAHTVLSSTLTPRHSAQVAKVLKSTLAVSQPTGRNNLKTNAIFTSVEKGKKETQETCFCLWWSLVTWLNSMDRGAGVILQLSRHTAFPYLPFERAKFLERTMIWA